MKTSSGRCVRKPYGPSTPLVEPGRIGGNQTRLAAVLLDVSTPNTLNADFDLMRSVAGITDARNEEIRAMLQAFIGRMSGVSPSVWVGSRPLGSRMWWIAGTPSRRGSTTSCTRSPTPSATTRPRCGKPAKSMPATSPPPAATYRPRISLDYERRPRVVVQL